MSWGPLQILLILLIVVLLFGTKKLRNLGADLGSSIKSFKKSMNEDEQRTAANNEKEQLSSGEQQQRTDKDDIR